MPRVRSSPSAILTYGRSTHPVIVQAGCAWKSLRGQDKQEGQTTKTQCTTLDAFVAERHIERLALVKIDVEGWELSVLRGARHVLNVLRPVVVFEYDPAYVSRSGGAADDVTRCWSDADYELFALDPRRPPALVARLGDRGGNFLALPRRAAGDR